MKMLNLDKLLLVMMRFVEKCFELVLGGGDPGVNVICGEGPVIISVTKYKSTKIDSILIKKINSFFFKK